MIFVTGASGFIGRYVVEKLLKEKQEVVVLVRSVTSYRPVGSERIIQGTLKNCGSFLEELQMHQHNIDTCIHLAWEGIPDYSYEMSKKNLQYGMHVLELCRELEIKHLIVTGSCWEYKDPKGVISETWPIDYSNHFKAAKNAFRMICDAFCREYEIQYHWLRLFYVYGEGQREGSLIPFIKKEFEAGRIPKLNGAYHENDFIHASDVAAAVFQVMKHRPEDTILNIGSGKATQVLDIVKWMGKRMNVEVSEKEFPKVGVSNSFWADIGKSGTVLRWKPKNQIIDEIGGRESSE